MSFNQHLINHNQEDPKEVDENHEIHTKRQMDLNNQLTEIQKHIVIKEGLAKQLNKQYIVDYEVSNCYKKANKMQFFSLGCYFCSLYVLTYLDFCLKLT